MGWYPVPFWYATGMIGMIVVVMINCNEYGGSSPIIIIIIISTLYGLTRIVAKLVDR